ncbi:MAG: NADH-quinone oxidoreductase subunit C [Mobiluncus porci]|uniref:NADH-quinone oxidoreductase subunit C n=1 Tax=Mobiluncus porci TaxID=2652278 RepID=A0A7K0K0S3_9ACTO|nr:MULTISPECIES: NADH-quinone oxidoreductase subunit C [Mobiluncus]MCI6585170.1 NADH-quinone oxidoreductase subunit C [Mobiluncus sp.]MDD7540608.1 NADH-quinone oxidoreductase subunit C [Mobiluncus porci]MDY5748733.1 NADH-quinone oxidoreductase subunit C [Mobiluncus porci]MST49018.1 NADH-quinone oxidoreductase subunit C [Mobiluncus porci]
MSETTQDLQNQSENAEVTESLPTYAKPLGEFMGVRKNPFGAHGTGDTSGYSTLQKEVWMPPQSPKPYGGWFDDCVDYLEEDLRQANLDPKEVIDRVVVAHGELTIHVNREAMPAVAKALRDDQDLRFELCLGVSGVHYPEAKGQELHAVYHFMSVTHNHNLRIETSAPDEDPKIPSIVDIYPGNNWHERETFDMFGIIFTGHPALTRSLLPDDWVGHPQRKDYPLGGIPVQFKGGTVPPADTRRNYS